MFIVSTHDRPWLRSFCGTIHIYNERHLGCLYLLCQFAYLAYLSVEPLREKKSRSAHVFRHTLLGMSLSINIAGKTIQSVLFECCTACWMLTCKDSGAAHTFCMQCGASLCSPSSLMETWPFFAFTEGIQAVSLFPCQALRDCTRPHRHLSMHSPRGICAPGCPFFGVTQAITRRVFFSLDCSWIAVGSL